MAKRQYVWTLRYGKTVYALQEFDGPYNSDIHEEGIQHAECMGKYFDSPSTPTPDVIYCSPFLRTTHTASTISKTIASKEVPIRVEDGLYEWLAPALLVEHESGVRTFPSSTEELKKTFPQVDESYKSVNPCDESEGEKRKGAPALPEDEEGLLLRCDTTLQSILSQCSNENDPNIVIVTHAPCNQAFAFAMEEDCTDPKQSKIGPWPTAGITRFSREITGENGSKTYGKWEMDYFAKTSHLPGKFADGTGFRSLPCFLKKEGCESKIHTSFDLYPFPKRLD